MTGRRIVMRRKVRLTLAALIAVLTATIGLTVSVLPASAAALTEVTGFGTNPTNLRMYLYVPNNLAAKPGLLVASHYLPGHRAGAVQRHRLRRAGGPLRLHRHLSVGDP